MIYRKLAAWMRIARLHFYVMTFIAYSLGASAACLSVEGFRAQAFVFGYLTLLFIELATVLANELFDYDTDRINRNAGPFTGGSRMLVEGRLSFREVRAGVLISLALAVASGVLLVTAGSVNV
jgi:4-hydroxybenzoate polyprenyltransferase